MTGMAKLASYGRLRGCKNGFFLQGISVGSGFGGLEVSVLAFGTRVREFKRGRSRRIFRAEKSSARLPSEEK